MTLTKCHDGTGFIRGFNELRITERGKSLIEKSCGFFLGDMQEICMGFTDDLYGKDVILVDKGVRVPNP